MKALFLSACHFVFLGLFFFGQAVADVPATLTYQGTLTDGAGNPVNGTKTITFSLYDVVAGGTAFWSETQQVVVNNGRFAVVLGGDTNNALDPDAFTGETYIGVQVDPDTEMPRQKFTSVAYALNAGNAADAIPRGVIVMWSGEVNDIPEGWALCDGQVYQAPNGDNVQTPDLQDRFIVGAGGQSSAYTIGVPGGVDSHDISHTHSIAAESPQTNAVNPGEQQRAPNARANNSGFEMGDWWSNPVQTHSHIVNSHDHGGSTGGGGNNQLDNRPRYYPLAFIMKL